MLVFKRTYLDSFLYSSSDWSLYRKKKKSCYDGQPGQRFKEKFKNASTFRDLEEEFQSR